MTVSLNADMERLVRDKVASGLYPSPDAVMAEALRLLETRDENERLRRDIEIGLEQLQRDEAQVYDEAGLKQLFDDVKTRGQKRLNQQHGADAAATAHP